MANELGDVDYDILKLGDANYRILEMSHVS